MSNIRTENNSHVIRNLGPDTSGVSGYNVLHHLCNNHTLKESLLMDFKFVFIDMTVRFNLDNSGDIFNYMNVLQSLYPNNMYFYDYKYSAYINIDEVTENWNADQELENVYYKTINDEIQKFAMYPVEPIFKITGITSSKNIELKGQPDNYVELNMEVYLKVPNRIGSSTINNQIVKGIQLIINSSDHSENLPILIDQDNDIYSSNRDKIERLYILSNDDFNINSTNEIYKLSVDPSLISVMENKRIAIYMITDTCLNDPDVLFIELGQYDNLVLTNKVLTNVELNTSGRIDIDIGATQLDKEELARFNFSEFSRLELLIFK